ncbi:fructosamine kinase family protein [Lacticaseibacillus nasuensis]|uniref:fructosamine kinase family protein n=1 Tax=Lacticaseibacillus nasuensis TaxID=944671 RepID=UPI00224834A6|nr:fructosamine kinase family protein [Lacticaseibacillus nasuensis]MCX2455824.1 fructosamine kinase family protein [Lacticaseibacillus nasuensis]
MANSWFTQLPIPGLQAVVPVGGGDVNRAYRLDTTAGPRFLLTQPHQPASFYAGEVAGLKALAQAGVLAPRVVATGVNAGTAYLVLTYLERGRGSQADLGRLVAKLHQFPSPTGQYGFDYPYVGTSISFTNHWAADWATLFVGDRLDPLAAKLRRDGRWQATETARYQQARAVIVAALAAHHTTPVLLHGDLWGGNYLFTTSGAPALIDPAAFYGDREFDLAITTVFGGFDAAFYEAYQNAYPLAPGFTQRAHFYRLYYLMVHLDKFGGGYAASVAAELTAVLN